MACYSGISYRHDLTIIDFPAIGNERVSLVGLERVSGFISLSSFLGKFNPQDLVARSTFFGLLYITTQVKSVSEVIAEKMFMFH